MAKLDIQAKQNEDRFAALERRMELQETAMALLMLQVQVPTVGPLSPIQTPCLSPIPFSVDVDGDSSM